MTMIENSSTPAPLWNVKQCAAYLGKSPRWLWSAITRRGEEPGSIPHVRIGNAPRFFPDDIAAWVRAGCPPAATFAEWNCASKPLSSRKQTADCTCPER